MFDKLQQLKKLKELQDEMKKQTFESEREGIQVSINGGLEIERIRLNPDLGIESQERALPECINEAMKKAQMAMAQKFQGFM